MNQQNHNPSIQCRICGRWMRLHGVDRKTGIGYQRFFGSYVTKEGTHREHDGDVCVPCESTLPDWGGTYDHPMLAERITEARPST